MTHILISGDGAVGIEEYRFDCVNRMAYKSIQELDDAYNKLITVSLRMMRLS